MLEITNSARSKASQLRRLSKSEPLDEDDEKWLDEYEASKTPKGKKASKIIHMEEHMAEASGTNEAIVATMAATGFAREDGRRLDAIVKIALSAMQQACDTQNRMTEQMMRRQEASENTVNDLLISIRTHFLERTQAENNLLLSQRQMEIDRMNALNASNDDDDEGGVIKMFEQAIVQKMAGGVTNAVMPGTVPKS